MPTTTSPVPEKLKSVICVTSFHRTTQAALEIPAQTGAIESQHRSQGVDAWSTRRQIERGAPAGPGGPGEAAT